MDGPEIVGGEAADVGNSEIGAPEGRMDVAVLWDIRMDPGFQGFGTRRALFESAAVWAREQDCVRLQAETQNVSACRFYA